MKAPPLSPDLSPGFLDPDRFRAGPLLHVQLHEKAPHRGILYAARYFFQRDSVERKPAAAEAADKLDLLLGPAQVSIPFDPALPIERKAQHLGDGIQVGLERDPQRPLGIELPEETSLGLDPGVSAGEDEPVHSPAVSPAFQNERHLPFQGLPLRLQPEGTFGRIHPKREGIIFQTQAGLDIFCFKTLLAAEIVKLAPSDQPFLNGKRQGGKRWRWMRE